MIAARPASHWLLLAGLVLMWGSSFVWIKVALVSFSPEAIVAIRIALAAVVLLVLLPLTGRRLPRQRSLWLYMAVMAVLGNALPFWLISWGQQGIDSGLSGILMAIMPLTTVVLAHFLLDDEPLTRRRITGFLLGFAGIVVLVGPEALLRLQGQGAALVSQLAVLAGAVCYAINTIIARRRPVGDSLSASAGVLLVASVLTIPVPLAMKAPLVNDVSWVSAFAVLFLGVVSTAAATVTYFKLISLAGPGFLSLTNYLIPPLAVLIGFLFLGEVPSWTALVGLALILSGIVTSEGRRLPVSGRRRATSEAL